MKECPHAVMTDFCVSDAKAMLNVPRFHSDDAKNQG